MLCCGWPAITLAVFGFETLNRTLDASRKGPPMDQLLTIEEAAERLRTSPGALHTQRYRGEAPGSLGVKIGKRILYRAADLTSYVAEQVAAQLADSGAVR